MKTKLNRELLDDLLMAGLAVVSIVILIYDVVGNQTPSQKLFLRDLDIGIGIIFLVEFMIHFFRAKEKHHFFSRRWWELLAAVPVIAPLRVLKIARIFPLLQSFRFVRIAYRVRLVLETSRWYTKYAYLIYIGTIVITVMLLGAFGFHTFEYGHNPNVHNFFDSIWWAIVTMTTIGYGDIYPVTVGGRIIAILLIFSGIGAFGALIGVIDQIVITRNREKLFAPKPDTAKNK
jgi:voltage-gated potassium channel